jgi:hypothetical protein
VTNRAPRNGVVLAGMIALACTAPESLGPGLNAALVQTCAPWDGPAVALFLTDQPAVATYPTPPYSAITVYKGVSEVMGRHFTVSPDSQNVGYANACPAVGDCQPARSASVTFHQLDADSTVEVEYRIDFALNRIVSGRVRARLHPAAGFCG